MDISKLTELDRLLYRELFKKDFHSFICEFWETCDPKPFVDGKIVQFFAETFQYMCRRWVPIKISNVVIKEEKDVEVIDVRQNKNNLCINLPPSHSKSKILNVLAGVWIFINIPIKLASISHTQGLSGDMNKGRQAVMNSEKFKFFFPEIVLVQNTSFSLLDNRGGQLFSINRDALTGYHADILIADDITNARTAIRDKEEMKNAWGFYQDTLPSRISDSSNYVIINIQQRLSKYDVTGHIMEDPKLAEQYTFVVLPARFEKKTKVVCPLSGDIFEYNIGDGLWPERFGDYKALEYSVGPFVWETQYLQKPISKESTVIKENMIHEKNINEVPNIDSADIMYLSNDFPVKSGEDNDFLGSVLAYKVGNTLYIKDALERHLDFNQSVDYIRKIEKKFPGIIFVVENKANGTPLLQFLQNEIPGMQAFEPGTQSKLMRLQAASLYMNNVVFIKSKFNTLLQRYDLTESMQNLKNQLLSFPSVIHDDLCDSFSQLLLFAFLEKKNQVYGRAFDVDNIIKNVDKYKDGYSNIFLNKEGDSVKLCEIAVEYNEVSKLIVTRELSFKGNLAEIIARIKGFNINDNTIIDCSALQSLNAMEAHDIVIEHYPIEDFDKSVNELNLALSKKNILIYKECRGVKADIENFRFAREKDENVKYNTEKDGYVSCLRVAMQYFGI